jgi:AcrR family transcriptional regulator
MDEKVRKAIREIVTKAEPQKDVLILRPLKQILKKELSATEGRSNDAEEIIKEFLEEIMDAYQGSRLRNKGVVRDLFMESLELAEKIGVDRGGLARELLYLTLQDSVADRRKRSRRKTQDKRERILSAALRVISEKGYEASSIETIAERAEVSKGSVYRYYSSKESLVNELINSMFDKLAEKIQESIHQDIDAIELIEVQIRRYLEFIEHNKDFYMMILNVPTMMGPVARAQYFTRILEQVPTLKQKIIEDAERRKIKVTSFFTVYYGVMGFLDGVIHKWLRSNCSYSLVDEIPIVLETVLHGIVNGEYARKHAKPYMEFGQAPTPSQEEESNGGSVLSPDNPEEVQ